MAKEDRMLSHSSDNLIERLYFGTVEQSVQDSALVPSTQLKPFNPDDLFQKDNTYGIYEEMLKDDQISVALRIKKDLVIASGFDIICEDDEIREDIEKAIYNDTECPFEDQLEEILTAYEFGFSVTEKIFAKRDDGTLTLKVLKTRHPASWIIDTDKQGNIKSFKQSSLSSDVDIDPAALIHYVNSPRFQNPYGNSDLRPAYLPWFTKRQVVKYYGIYLEKSASPIPVGKYGENSPASFPEKLLSILKGFKQKTAVVVPKEVDIEWLTNGNQGDAYVKGINLFNMFIGRALFVPDLLGFQGAETSGGSFSLGQQQFQLYAKHVEKRRQVLESLINEHVIKPLVIHNFGFVDNMPEFRLKPIEDENAIEAAKVWLEAVKGRAYKPSDEEINHFRSIIKFPEGEVVRQEPMPDPTQGQNPFAPIGNDPSGNDQNQDDEYLEMNPSDIEKMQKFASKPYQFPPGDYHKKVNFKQLERSLDTNIDLIKADTKPIIDLIFQDLYDQLERKRIVNTGNVERLETIKLRKLKDLKQVLKKSLKKQYLEGKILAQGEIFKSNFAAPIVDDKFLEILEAETFNFIGKWEYNVTEQAKLEMIAAIKDGRSVSSVIDILDQGAKESSNISLERYARTKTTEVLNKGRIAFFNDTGVISGYQYSAIMDGRTSEICSGLDGKIFKKGNEPVPPMHFNCRSILVPITVFEEYEPTETIIVNKDNQALKTKTKDSKEISIDQYIDKNLGAGFSKK